ncbi:hypothetical protein Tco_0409374 [Tanacetum coccineum]
MEDDKETDEHEEVEEVEEDDEVELKKHLVIVKDDEIAIYAITTCRRWEVLKRLFSMIRMLQVLDKED